MFDVHFQWRDDRRLDTESVTTFYQNLTDFSVFRPLTSGSLAFFGRLSEAPQKARDRLGDAGSWF